MRWSWCINRHKVHNKYNELESSWNYPPSTLPPSPWENYLPQNWCSVPKKLGTAAIKSKTVYKHFAKLCWHGWHFSLVFAWCFSLMKLPYKCCEPKKDKRYACLPSISLKVRTKEQKENINGSRKIITWLENMKQKNYSTTYWKTDLGRKKKTEETPKRAEESRAFPERTGHKLKQRHHQYNMQAWTSGPRTGELLNNFIHDSWPPGHGLSPFLRPITSFPTNLLFITAGHVGTASPYSVEKSFLK